jgi:branched-chain amino acid transport system substrate-binding protein
MLFIRSTITYSIIIFVSSFIIASCAPQHQPIPKQQARPAPQIPVPTVPAGPVKIALLLPLSGPSKELGQSMLDAAQLALFNSKMKNLQLLSFDTESNPAAASQAARSAIAQGVKLVIGPVFSKTTSAVSPITRAAKVNMLSFSNNNALKGEGVFLIGFMPDQQIKRVARYAVDHALTDFYVLAPANAYGKMAADSLTEALANTEGTVQKTEFYPEQGGGGLALSIKSIGDALRNAMNVPGKAEQSALLVPEGGDRLAKITGELAASGVDFKRIKLIGSGQWDDDSTKRLPLVQGGWFAGSSPEQHTKFEQQFIDQFGYKPVRIASLSYDAVALVAALVNQQQGITTEALTMPQGFNGIDGIFRFRKDGLSERGLSVLQVTGNEFQAVDPAPVAFSDMK